MVLVLEPLSIIESCKVDENKIVLKEFLFSFKPPASLR